jgi:peroxiredoxin
LAPPAPAFSLPATDGKTYSLESFREAKALVVVFTCNHCPYANAVEDRLLVLAREYAAKGVAVVGINPNDAVKYPADSFEAMKARAAEKGYTFPYLRDESQEVARAFNAACTPDIFVFDGARALVYNGQLDDNWKDASAVTRHDLRLVLDATLAGTKVAFDHAPAMGCSIKWKS